MRAAALFALCPAACAAARPPALTDLQRSRAKVPRSEYKGAHFKHMGQVLNRHLARSHANTRACHTWTPEELQRLQLALLKEREPALDGVYAAAGDARALRHGGGDGHIRHWADVNASVAAGNALLRDMQRDGHCHEAVMWYVHHLSHDAKQRIAHLELPRLPLVEWRRPTDEEGAHAARVYEKHYNPNSNCQSCHAGGIMGQACEEGKDQSHCHEGDNDREPPALPKQVNGNDRKRRCDEYYDAEGWGGACGACDGIAGAQWGDLADEAIYPDCTVVAAAGDVPVADRVVPTWPNNFAVEMRGSDRWPRSQPGWDPACNYTTDCSPIGPAGTPQPPTWHWWAQIHGILYLDEGKGHFGGGRLRHETVNEIMPNGREGAERSLRGQFGINNEHFTMIHIQNASTGSLGKGGALDTGIILNIDHNVVNAANKSGVDDAKDVDWRRIPVDVDGDTSLCLGMNPGNDSRTGKPKPHYPAGLPDFMGAMSNGTYLGRARFIPWFQCTGTGGPPCGKEVVADHYVKWFFHMFFDIDSQLPVALTSPYGGCATYGNWTMTADHLWPEWRENPSHSINVAGDDTCNAFM